jgi:signal transduction histidine kinase
MAKTRKKTAFKRIEFTVDSALLRELGERLVGRPHIALAELIKNSYDADATRVEVSIADDQIEVLDDGHGMDFDAFKHYWMRIGSPHKDRTGVSPGGRNLTGSKGVGRLSAQFLAERITLTTRATTRRSLRARVNWTEAVAQKDLTKASARYGYVAGAEFAGGADHGTRIVLSGLKQVWDAKALEKLARELWPLQPPYADVGSADAFVVDLEAEDDPTASASFNWQMRAILELWQARIIGKIEPAGKGSRLTVSVQFRDDERIEETTRLSPRRLEQLTYEIRVFDLNRRQPYGIKVEDAREYLNDYGGVHIYDAGFHLPYYGPKADWLGVEFDHSHRLSASKLLPRELEVKGGMSHLPTNSRLYGWVNVDTSKERRVMAGAKPSSEALAIQISRDRLIDNDAFGQLRDAVRWGLDLYAMCQARRTWGEGDENLREGAVGLSDRAQRVEQVLERHRSDMSDDAFEDLRTGIEEAIHAAESQAERSLRQAGLLGALATAGISAVATEHEIGRQTSALTRIARRLRKIAKQNDDPELDALASDLEQWTQDTQRTRQLFLPLMDEDTREEVRPWRAHALLARTVEQSAFLLRGVDVDLDAVPESLYLPNGRFVEWSALFQNVLVNAANATIGQKRRKIAASASRRRDRRRIHIQDTGSGVDLGKADQLFEPFERLGNLSRQRRDLGAGGSGLGLTIVRMIAANLDCAVGFVEPDRGWSTCFELTWRTE